MPIKDVLPPSEEVTASPKVYPGKAERLIYLHDAQHVAGGVGLRGRRAGAQAAHWVPRRTRPGLKPLVTSSRSLEAPAWPPRPDHLAELGWSAHRRLGAPFPGVHTATRPRSARPESAERRDAPERVTSSAAILGPTNA